MRAHPERLLRHLPSVMALPEGDHPDDELLHRFVGGQEEAFAALVRRHGDLVLGVCRRILGHTHAAEDAFQATWLVLARKAGSVRRTGGLAAWLHSVARQVALNARRSDARRRRHEAQALLAAPTRAQADPLDELTARELLAVLDEEVDGLPLAYRSAVVLCCLEGLSLEEAACRLGWAVGSVKGRLERGRRRLHERLLRRGLTLGAALGAAALARGEGKASASLLASTAQAATRFAAGEAAPGQVAALAKGVLTAMSRKKFLLTAAVVLAVGLSVTSGLVAYSLAGPWAGEEAEESQEVARAPRPGSVLRAPAPTEAPLAWGPPRDGLRVGLAKVGGEGTRLRVALENVGKDDLVVNLGLMLANGKKQFPSALRLRLTDGKGGTHSLRWTPPFVAGRVDPFVVPLPAGCRYSLRCDLPVLTEKGTPTNGLAGRYQALVDLVGKGVREKDTNQDMPGLALMTYWKGTVQTQEVPLTLPGPPG